MSFDQKLIFTRQAQASPLAQLFPLRFFLEEYIRRYEAAQLTSFLELWHPDGVQELRVSASEIMRRDTTREALVRSYQGMFKRMNDCHYRLTVNNLRSDDTDRYFVDGTYRIEYTSDDEQLHRFEGYINFTLVPSDDGLKVLLVSFQPTTFT